MTASSIKQNTKHKTSTRKDLLPRVVNSREFLRELIYSIHSIRVTALSLAKKWNSPISDFHFRFTDRYIACDGNEDFLKYILYTLLPLYISRKKIR